jgi:hypothetical protein
MDITIVTMLPERGETDFSSEKIAKYRHLCIIKVHEHQLVDVVHSPRTGLLHVTGINHVPGGRPGKTMFDKMASYEEQWIEPVVVTAEPSTRMVEKRAWSMSVDALTPEERRTLLAERQLSITSDRFFGALKHKGAN